MLRRALQQCFRLRRLPRRPGLSGQGRRIRRAFFRYAATAPGKANTTKKRLFGSQETPEDAGMPEAQAARDAIISPGTLKAVASQAIQADDVTAGGKKGRKRNKKPKLDASSQKAVPDLVPRIKWHENHEIGKPILCRGYVVHNHFFCSGTESKF